MRACSPSDWRSSASLTMARWMRSSRSWSRNGFCRKSKAPCCMASTAIGMSPWPVMKITGNHRAAQVELLLQLQAAHAGHADVEHQAAGLRGLIGGEEFLRRRVQGALQPHGLEQRRAWRCARPESSSTTMTMGFFFMTSVPPRPAVARRKQAPCGLRRAGADSTAMRLHDGTADGQSQAGAGILGGGERLE